LKQIVNLLIISYMTSKKALVAADLDDLLFADRNRNYGAYELRKNYDKRLTVALLAAVSFFILILAGLNKLPNPKSVLTVLTPYHKQDSVNFITIYDDNQKIRPTRKTHTTDGISLVLTDENTRDIDTGKIHTITGKGHGDLLAGLMNDADGNDLFGIPGTGPQVTVKPKIFDPEPDQNAEFPGGEKAYENYLKNNIKYPNFAAVNGIEGTIWLSLKIDEQGRVVDVSVMKSIGGGCDEEAARVLQQMPQWRPGRKNGENIAVIRYVRVNMVLK
jgi:periplasmic protein TonB